MNRFSTERKAKEFLVAEITREAARQGKPLADIEQKMLYFSESGWTLPDIADVAEKFDQQVAAKSYERRVGRIARSARRNGDPAAWSDAIKRLETGDHYLMVIIDPPDRRHSKDITWRTAVAVIVLLIMFGAIRPLVLEWILGRSPTAEDIGFSTWVIYVVLAVAYYAIRFVAGRDRLDHWLDQVFEWFERGRRT